MSLDIEQFQKKINEASPLEVPFLLMQLEQYDCESAQDMLERINKDFQKEDMINNVVTPVMTSIVDSLLMLPIFKGFTRKLGLIMTDKQYIYCRILLLKITTRKISTKNGVLKIALTIIERYTKILAKWGATRRKELKMLELLKI